MRRHGYSIALLDHFIMIAVNRGWGKGRHTHGDILGALRGRRAVAHPLATLDDNGLSRSDSVNALASLDLELSAQNHGELVELWCLPRLTPARWTDHACHAHAFSFGVRAANELLYDFWRLAVSLDSRWCFNELWHVVKVWRSGLTRIS